MFAVSLCVCISAALWPSACVVTEVGTTWEWNLAMSASVPTTGDVTVGDQSLVVELERALVSVVALEAIPCDDATTARWGSMSWLSHAQAHGGATPTRMAVPHVIDLLSNDTSHWAVALNHPPPGAYCWVRLTIGPADRDAVGMPDDENLTDTALRLRGRYGREGEPIDQPFTVSSTRVQSIDVRLLDSHGAEAPLSLSKTRRDVAVDVWFETPRVLDGVDITSAVESSGGLYAITNLLASVHVAGCLSAPCRAR